MSEQPDNPFQVRPGRIRSLGSGRRAKTFLSRMSKTISSAGGPKGRSGFAGNRAKSSASNRRVVVKARIVRMAASTAGALTAHINYIKRDSAFRGEEQGRVFGSDSDDISTAKFVENAEQDRHHFRFIVSPEDGSEMQDMKPFVRDLMTQMETDLETKLDWVAAVHDDTAHLHAHIVVRGRREDGRDLVMPRAYISHGIRDRAEELVTVELGPETAIEAASKIGREARAERMTRIDRFLLRQSDDDGHLKLRDSPPRYRAVHAARLKTLQQLGLAEKTGRGRWQLSDQLEKTLTGLSERRDILKTMNRALAGRTGRRFDPNAVLDRADLNSPKLTGEVIAKGLRREGHDRAYVVIDGLDGRAVYAEIGGAEKLDDVERGMIVSLSPPTVSAKPSDRTIVDIAAQHEGTYSAGFHQRADPSASPDFIAAHIRRLEAMRRLGLVTRSKDGTWTIPPDYETKVETQQRRQAEKQPMQLQIDERLPLQNQVSAIGATWLDRETPKGQVSLGFGADVQRAIKDRRVFLTKLGIGSDPTRPLGKDQLAALTQRDLDEAGKDLSAKLGKPYSTFPQTGKVEGTYSHHVDRASGRFAVIDRGKDFTLAPWRQVLEQSKGRMVSGTLSRENMNWTLTKSRGLVR